MGHRCGKAKAHTLKVLVNIWHAALNEVTLCHNSCHKSSTVVCREAWGEGVDVINNMYSGM